MAQTGGVKPMSIAGRVASERERCLGMTSIERNWRKQWLKDQVLAPNEPVHVEGYRKELMNPIKRLYRAPLDKIFNMFVPVLGAQAAADFRYVTGKLGLMALFILSTHYYFKYNGNDWTKKGGWRILQSKPMVLPGQPGFPFKSNRTDADYANRGFKNAPI